MLILGLEKTQLPGQRLDCPGRFC